MTYIPAHQLKESIQKEVDYQLKPLIKKFVGDFLDLPSKNSPNFTPHTFEEFEDKEFYSREEVQKNIINSYYSEAQVTKILKDLEKNLQKGFSSYISSVSIPIESIKKTRLASQNVVYHEQEVKKSVETGVKGILDGFK